MTIIFHVKTFRITDNFDIQLNKNTSCIGFFDGVHLGHKALIDKTIQIAKDKSIDANLITFDPDPDIIISKSKQLHINTLEQRLALFDKFGIQNTIVIEFNKELMSLEPNVFIDSYIKKLNIDTLVCGFDFSFGKYGKGNYQTLIDNGIKTVKINEVTYKNEKISSTRIRKAIQEKDYELADLLLGYHYKSK